MPGPDAALAAAQLLALFADPVHRRGALTRGREPFPGALHAFRFAQGRVPDAVKGALAPGELARLPEAAAFFIREVCLWDEATHYQVLGVAPAAGVATIKDHYHALMALFHPDRQAASAFAWPGSAAPRVNEAYAVLSDEARRRDYDASIEPAAPEVQPARALPRRSRREPSPGARHAKAVAMALAGLAAIFFLWTWFDEEPDPLAPLHSAARGERPLAWMRDSLAPALRPKFLAPENATAAPGTVAAAEMPAGLISPLPHARLAHVAAAPVLDAPAVEPARAAEPRPPAKASPATRVAEAVAAPEPARPAAPVGEALAGDLELLVSQVVSNYEAGDLDSLLALFDASRIGVFESMGVRHDFEAFFQSTRARQLQVRTLTWEARPDGARARGEALVRATYPDPSRGTVERVVPIDLAIAVRNGRPRIVQLTLFPHE